MLRVGIDIGGTFTDLVAARADGRVFEAKTPSDRERPERALETGLRLLAEQTGHADVETLLADTRIVIQGSTVAINAVLQRRGVATGLLCTQGFRDTLEIRQGWKEERYVFPYTPPPVLVPRTLRLPVRERIDADGSVRSPLAEEDVEAAAERFRAAGVEAVAVCFLWSFLDARHERRAAEILRNRLPGVFVTVSSDVLPQIREYNRASTTVLNAYVGPIVERHILQTERILRDLGFAGRIRYVQSNGGLAEASEVTRRPVLLLVSGPAAAPAAGLHFAALAGRDFITVDMGGTSFDTVLVRDGFPDMRSVSDVNGYRVATPLIDVHTIGAGGGSIASLDAGLLRVGPESAEADPGPACYMRGGTEPTVTDANVVCGLLNQERLLGGRFPIDAGLARAAVEEKVAAPAGLPAIDAAAGVIEVVSHDMADAIREITVRRGHDPRDFSILCGGGAGGLHAARLAEELGVRRIVVPRVASAFCAFGAVVADIRHDYVRALVADTEALDFASVDDLFTALEQNGRQALAEEGVAAADVRFLRTLDLRYKDQVWEVTVSADGIDLRDPMQAQDESVRRFHRRHAELYDYAQPGHRVELVSLTLTAIGLSPPLLLVDAAPDAAGDPGPSGGPAVHERRSVRFARALPPVDTPVVAGESVRPGHRLAGPVIVEEPNTTIAVPPGWTAVFHATEQSYVLTREEPGG